MIALFEIEGLEIALPKTKNLHQGADIYIYKKLCSLKYSPDKKCQSISAWMGSPLASIQFLRCLKIVIQQLKLLYSGALNFAVNEFGPRNGGKIFYMTCTHDKKFKNHWIRYWTMLSVYSKFRKFRNSRLWYIILTLYYQIMLNKLYHLFWAESDFLNFFIFPARYLEEKKIFLVVSLFYMKLM